MYTIDDLLEYIKNTLDDKDNIFLHGIETESHSEKEKLQSIIQNGLECNYFTIFRTVRELGKLEKITADKFNYAFMSRGQDTAINLVLSIPDVLVNDDEVIPVFPQDYGNIKDDDGGVRTFLDVILSKGMGINIPREFIFGFYEMNLKTGVIRFCENDEFYSKLNEEKYQEFFNFIKEKLERKGYGYLLELCKNLSKENIDNAYKISSLLFFDEKSVSKNVIDKINEYAIINKNRGM